MSTEWVAVNGAFSDFASQGVALLAGFASRTPLIRTTRKASRRWCPCSNRYKPIGTTAEVDFKTTRPCWSTRISHIDQVVADTKKWEQSATFRLEQQVGKAVRFYARNDHLGLVIPYEYQGIQHGYEPDFLARLANDVTLILEIKGFEDERDRAKSLSH